MEFGKNCSCIILQLLLGKQLGVVLLSVRPGVDWFLGLFGYGEINTCECIWWAHSVVGHVGCWGYCGGDKGLSVDSQHW